MAITSKQVLSKIKCNHLSLFKGDGYWYFVYDDAEKNIFETKSIPVMFLNQMPLDMWVQDGVDFVNEIEEKGL